MTAAERISNLLAGYPTSARATRGYQPKSKGGYRPIAKPNKELKVWLRTMNKALSAQYGSWPTFMHGGIKKRSYISYARPHVNKPCVITIDIERCFELITTAEITQALQQHMNLTDDVCIQLAQRLCFKGQVPQGFPTSNFLCNLYLLDPLSQMQQIMEPQGIAFSNYVDDIAASGTISNSGNVVNQIVLALSQARLKTNKAKIVVMPSSKRQIICGLIVNKRLSLTKTLKLQLLAAIAQHSMSEESASGWVAHLKNVDPKFQQKLYDYAIKKGVLKVSKER
jgi:RNA-directed DNA polymerase